MHYFKSFLILVDLLPYSCLLMGDIIIKHLVALKLNGSFLNFHSMKLAGNSQRVSNELIHLTHFSFSIIEYAQI